VHKTGQWQSGKYGCNYRWLEEAQQLALCPYWDESLHTKSATVSWGNVAD
jgi:hypothetical protein